jgi:hypothetical protein
MPQERFNQMRELLPQLSKDQLRCLVIMIEELLAELEEETADIG